MKFVILKDFQSINDALDDKVTLVNGGVEFEIDEIKSYENKQLNVFWDFFTFKNQRGIHEVVLVRFYHVLTPDEPNYFVYFKPEDFTPGTREEVYNSGYDWLFDIKGPGDSYDELEYSLDFVNAEDILFHSHVGSLPVDCVGDESGYVSLLTEWIAQTACDNPYCLVLETGDYIQFFNGINVDDSEVEFI